MSYQPKITEAKPIFHRVESSRSAMIDGETRDGVILVGLRVRLHSGHTLFRSTIHRTISVTEPPVPATDEFGRPKLDERGRPVMIDGEKVTGYRDEQFRRTYAHCPNFIAAAYLGFARARSAIGRGNQSI